MRSPRNIVDAPTRVMVLSPCPGPVDARAGGTAVVGTLELAPVAPEVPATAIPEEDELDVEGTGAEVVEGVTVVVVPAGSPP